MDEIDKKVQEVIMNAYDVRPSTAYELMTVVKRMAELSQKEYEYGRQDANYENN